MQWLSVPVGRQAQDNLVSMEKKVAGSKCTKDIARVCERVHDKKADCLFPCCLYLASMNRNY